MSGRANSRPLFLICNLAFAAIVVAALAVSCERGASAEVRPLLTATTDVAELQSLAEKGDAQAQFLLGEAYRFGHAVPRDYALAYRWYILAAKQGNPKAQYYVALVDHTAGDYIASSNWLIEAGRQGHAEAQSGVGQAFWFGEGVSQSYTEAVKWYRAAAEQGNVDAQFHLGEAYVSGRGVFQDHCKAAQWYRKAAALGNLDAQARLRVLEAKPTERPMITESHVKFIEHELHSFWGGLDDLPKEYQIEVTVRLRLNRDGSLNGNPVLVTPDQRPVGRGGIATDRALYAVGTYFCLRSLNLPKADYPLWMEVDVSFSSKNLGPRQALYRP